MKLNDASLHDPFSTPFIDEVLEGVGGHEIYSFMDGFLGYHQIRIAKEDRNKTTFMIEWGSFQYSMMSFGLKNAPTIVLSLVVAEFEPENELGEREAKWFSIFSFKRILTECNV